MKLPNTPVIYRQGDNATIAIEVAHPLNGNKLKVGIYSPLGRPLYETNYPDGDIVKVDDKHFILELAPAVTITLQGKTSLRICQYSSDLSVVNSGENDMTLIWEPEPVNKNLL